MKKQIEKRLLSIILALALVLTMMPVIPGAVQTVEAKDFVVSELELTCDMNVIDLNTAWTEGDVQQRIRDNAKVATDGLSINKSNTWLEYKLPEGYFSGIGTGAERVKADQVYYIKYALNISDGYVWPDGVSEGDFSAFTVKVNGIDKTSEVESFDHNEYSNRIYITLPIGTASEDPIVTSVIINENNVSVEKGGRIKFTGKVNGSVKFKTISWSVIGNTSNDTVIDKSSGVLTVGTDETAKTLTVIAVSNVDKTKYASVKVTITEAPPVIDSVTITPNSTEILQGASQHFNVKVSGTQVDKSVIWSVENAESDGTVIDENGNLTIGADETAATIIVKATARQDNTKSGTATVTVLPGVRIDEVDLTYDLGVIDLSVTSTEGDVQQRIRDNIKTTTEGVTIDTSNSWLMYKLADGNFSGIGDGTNKVKSGKTYYIEYCLKIPAGYNWAHGVSEEDYSGLTVNVNGVDKTSEVAEFSYNDSSRKLHIFIPIGETTGEDIVFGDANGDSKINVKDATLVLQYANKKITSDKLDLAASDVTGDGKVNVKDATMILQYANKKIDSFPAAQ